MDKDTKYSGGKCFKAVLYSSLSTDHKLLMVSFLSGCLIDKPHVWRYNEKKWLVHVTSLKPTSIKKKVQELVDMGYLDRKFRDGKSSEYKVTTKIFDEYVVWLKTQAKKKTGDESNDNSDDPNANLWETKSDYYVIQYSRGETPPDKEYVNLEDHVATLWVENSDYYVIQPGRGATPSGKEIPAVSSDQVAARPGGGRAATPNYTKLNVPKKLSLLTETQNLQQVQNLVSDSLGLDLNSQDQESQNVVSQDSNEVNVELGSKRTRPDKKDEVDEILGIFDPFEAEEMAEDIVKPSKPMPESIQGEADDSRYCPKQKTAKKRRKTVSNDMSKSKETPNTSKRTASCTQIEGFKGKLFLDHYFVYLQDLWGDKAPTHHLDQKKAVKIVQKHGLELAQVVADYYWGSDYYMADRYHIIRCYSFRLFSDLFDEILANFSKNISLEDRDRRIKGVKNRAKQRRMRGNFNYQP